MLIIFLLSHLVLNSKTKLYRESSINMEHQLHVQLHQPLYQINT
jgi:hypothetical protein